jgi:hypothetical protein
MTDDEQVDLISAVWRAKAHDSLTLLEELARRVPPHHTAAQEELRDAFRWLSQHELEKGAEGGGPGVT